MRDVVMETGIKILISLRIGLSEKVKTRPETAVASAARS
jgi:hypothetical protein